MKRCRFPLFLIGEIHNCRKESGLSKRGVNVAAKKLDLRIERKLHSFFLLGVVPKEMPLIRLILQNTFYAFLGKTSPESYSCRRRL